jgi:hypothetical protein
MAVEDIFQNPTDEALSKDIKTMDPFVVIVEAARAMGIEIQKPKPNCKKCHGRGYVGRHSDSGEPIACTCIFPKQKFDREIGEIAHKPMNRAERRAMKKKG